MQQTTQGFILDKGEYISLRKDGKLLENVFFGMDWGMIHSPLSKYTLGLLGSGKVDLDASAVTFDYHGQRKDLVFFSKQSSADGAIRHSGDDRKGDISSDNLDNEIIAVNLNKIHPGIKTIVFFINSFKGHDFSKIPYTKIRLFEGSVKSIKSLFASYNVSLSPDFKGKTSMILGKLVRELDGWKFYTIGEPCKSTDMMATAEEIRKKYLG